MAKEKNKAAEDKFNLITTSVNADQLFKEGHRFILDANKYIKDAHAQLVKIIKEMKEIIKSTPTPTPAS
ncbi:MAG: hypothetical protein V1732_01990 [Patescibacteria group bacterium]